MTKNMTIDELREKGWIAYEYIRGSHAYGLNTPTSDEDHGGVFICPQEDLYGLRDRYPEQVQDAKGDVVFYEFGRWIELLLKSNPTALESLFIPERCVVGDIHPVVKAIIDNRDMFLSKECFKTLTGYAHSQIGKARGLNKKIVNPIVERKGVLDFCYVPYKQGTKKVEDWLRDRGLKQKYCGLVALPNMHDAYGLYYDYGTHLICEYGADLKEGTNISEVWDKLCKETDEFEYVGDTQSFTDTLEDYLATWSFNLPYVTLLKKVQPFGFRGIVHENNDSNEVRVCEIPKGITPLIIMTYNQSGYESHCRDYKEYKEWEANRNPVRYESNLGQNYDGKNMSHCMRLMRMGKELAMGQGLNIDRTGIDREYLLSIKNHELDYDEVMTQANAEKAAMEAAEATCMLPAKLDYDKINELLINVRKEVYSK